MGVIDAAFSANATLANEYDARRGRAPAPRLAIVTCADSRLTGVLPLLGVAADDADVIRNAGGIINEDSVRSLAVSTHVLGVKEIMIIGHTNCALQTFTDDDLASRLPERRPAEHPEPRFSTFTDLEENVRKQVNLACSHPWLPGDVAIRGFILDVKSGRLREVSPARNSVPA
ncbi:carbonic anhydrase [Rugosimonospora acidiphila]|uniref:carbonic anhydrase n=1 Tax=Rugosimonospora acidiphila TaxID=556531 RepID=A0ABP9SB55_9ACTN